EPAYSLPASRVARVTDAAQPSWRPNPLSRPHPLFCFQLTSELVPRRGVTFRPAARRTSNTVVHRRAIIHRNACRSLSTSALAVHRRSSGNGSMTALLKQVHTDIICDEVNTAFRADVLRGLSARQKAIPARWLYDRRGSELFEAITELPEYYVARTERSILDCHFADIAKVTGLGRAVVEFGSGSSTKTRLLLSAIQPTAYVPIDISFDIERLFTVVLAEVTAPRSAP